MKIFVVLLLLALSVQAFLPGSVAKRAPTDGSRHLTPSSGALGALVMAGLGSNLADAIPGRRRRRRRRFAIRCIGSVLCGK